MRGKKAVIGWLFLAGLAGLLSACAPEGSSPQTGPVVLDEQPPEEAVARARMTAEALSTEVVSRLFLELEDGNPVNAIEVCSEAAQELADSYSKDGLLVRRVSRRFRNPADEPDEYEYAKLAALQDLHDRGELPTDTAEVVMMHGTKSLRYLKPLVLKQPCLMCHGPVGQIDSEVLDVIRSRYPGDRAIGFEVDDLRGAISVTVEL